MDYEKLRGVKALVSDVDGVFTDGSIVVGEGGELKFFSVRDGLAVKLLQAAGIQFAILSGRASKPVEKRAAELGIQCVKVGRGDKQVALNEISEELGIPPEEMAYIGDDLPDLAPLQMVAAGFCPQDAVDEVKAEAWHVVPVIGGRGVVRYVAELLLKSQDRWAETVRRFEVQNG